MFHAPAVEFPGTARFTVLRRLGQGGMGTVYEVLDRERNTRLALKTLTTLNADTLLLFKNEFRALQDIQHPNLVRLGELFEEAGQWFFTMELVEGTDFMSYIYPDRDSAVEQSTERDTLTAASLNSAETCSIAPPLAQDVTGDTADLEGAPDSLAQNDQNDQHDQHDQAPHTERTGPAAHTGLPEPPLPKDLPHDLPRDLPRDLDNLLDETLRAPAAALQAAVDGARRFDEQRLRQALGQLAQGVYALHAAQKIHRDLKPS
ncbi:MAG TPA: protein kinase, partial [Pseudomonadota bacterium]|nr:protein kinase [Pseudomonadota bacterium]